MPGEAQRVDAVRALSKEIDWECETKTLFRSSNRGCKLAVSEAITWFFEQVDAGVIMEDDCVPDSSFFPFAAELLERYAHENRVFLISGNNFQKISSDRVQLLLLPLCTYLGVGLLAPCLAAL